MKRSRMVLATTLAIGALALAACGRDAAGGALDEQGMQDLTVIDAVQLGAAQSCNGAAGTAVGSIAIVPLVGDQGLVLLLDDGYPLCIDTMENAAGEIARLEASYIELTEQETETGPGDQGAITPLLLPTGDERETDPNPQPALKAGATGTIIASASTTGTVPQPVPSNPPPAPDRPTTDD